MQHHAELLAWLFPELSFAKNADVWLASIQSKTICGQLKERRIAVVEFEALEFGGDIGVDHKYGFDFSIRLNTASTLEKKIRDLGHEVGHTFHFDLTKNIGSDRLMSWSSLPVPETCRLVEKFCDSFAQQWICANGAEKIAMFLKSLEKG